MPSLRDALRAAERRLAEAGVDNPHLDARLLAAEALQIDRAQLLSQSERTLTNDEQQRIDALIEKRARREPVSRILGRREFWSLSFALNEATLVPRPESETLIEAALEHFKPRDEEPLRILDLGTGSGCLLLALLHEFREATGLGVDKAMRAVEQAQKNAEKLGLAARTEFRAGDWAEELDERFDLVTCNPPYIARGDIEGLMREVRDFDPRLALDGGADGLDAYRLLIPRLPGLLKPRGVAAFEVGVGHASAVSALFSKAGFSSIETRKDLSDIERCVTAHIP